MKILGIETSCDETAAAIVEDGKKILSNIVASSQDIHAKTGGIIPEQAARQQIKSIIPVIKTALKEAGVKENEIDSIAVTTGPGLIGSLLVGVETAKTLSLVWKKPVIPINHLAAHIYANWLGEKTPSFPALCLVVSGGHTDLVVMEAHGKMRWIGGTRDDAAGEAFDKTARLLALPYPGGPSISKAAEKYMEENKGKKLNLFPRPMINNPGYEWSFSGLKTAVLNEIKRDKNPDIGMYSAEVQEAIVDVLSKKTIKAARKIKPKSILLAGGVSANKRLKEIFETRLKTSALESKLFVPEPKLCTDNATYIASCAFYNNFPAPLENINANPELSVTDQT